MTVQARVLRAIEAGQDTYQKIHIMTGIPLERVRIAIKNLRGLGRVSAKVVSFSGDSRSVYTIAGTDLEEEKDAAEDWPKKDPASIVAQAMKTQPNSVWALGR